MALATRSSESSDRLISYVDSLDIPDSWRNRTVTEPRAAATVPVATAQNAEQPPTTQSGSPSLP